MENTQISNHRKYLLAHILGNSSEMSYNEKMMVVENNLYNYIWKCPISIFIVGALELKFTDGYQFDLETLKREFVELIEDLTGFELTFTDFDWDNISIEETSWGKKVVGTSKSYMSEFFEL
jgi:hypothetical protein